MKGCAFVDKEVQLAKEIIKRLRKLLEKKFSYIVSFAPSINFYESCDELFLREIRFEADGNFQDAIVINENGALLELEEGLYQALFNFVYFEDILELEEDDISSLRADIEDSVRKANELYIKRNH